MNRTANHTMPHPAALLGQAQSAITRLDTIVRNKYSNHPDTLAAWKSATHIPRGGDRKKDDPAVVPTS